MKVAVGLRPKSRLHNHGLTLEAHGSNLGAMADVGAACSTIAARVAEARERYQADPQGAREACLHVLRQAESEGDSAATGEARLLLGECCQGSGEHAPALEHFDAAVEAFRSIGERRREAEAHRLIAFSHDMVGDFDGAHDHHLRALELLEAVGDERGMSHVLRTIGVSASKSRDYEQGLEWYRRSLDLARRIGDEDAAARTLNNIGLDLKNLGRIEDSLAAHEEAITLFRRLGNARSESAALGNLAHTLDLLRRDADAERAYRDAIARCRADENRHGLTNAMVGMGRMCVRLGRVDEAVRLLREGLAVAEAGAFRPDIADALEVLARAEKLRGEAGAALAYFERFLDLTRAMMVDESQRRLKGLELRLQVDQAQREATGERRRSRELAEANDRLQAAAADRNELLRLLERQSREDALTGLANRRHLDHQLDEALAEAVRLGGPLSVALVEIDHFQRLSDSFSPAAGDSMLLELARLVRAHLGDADVAARVGQETFAIVFAGRDVDSAQRACELVREAVEAHDWAMIHQWLKVTVSAGVAEAGPGSTPERLLAEADLRLRAAKAAGANRVSAAPVAPPAGRASSGRPEIARAAVGSDPRRGLILAEQVRSSYANLPIAFAAGLVGATLLCFVVRDLIPARVWATWLAGMFGVSAGLGALYGAYRRRKPEGDEVRRWGQFVTAGSFLAGGLWGLSALLLHTPDSIDYQIMVAATAAIVGSSVAFASATYLPPFLAFFYPAVIPNALLFLSKDDNTRFVIGLMLLLYLPIVTRFAVTLNRAFIETLRLRFQNVALVGELRDRKDAAERANLAKSRFLAAASHDLRQPMHALGLFLQALRQGKLGERERKLVDNIGESFNAMDELFNALLDISRLDAGVVEPRIATFPVARVLDRMRKEYGPQAAGKGLALVVRPCAGFVRSDPVLLEEIVGNLISNAVRYTRSGRVLVGCRHGPNGALRIEVWDTGRGIPPDKLREVFREFIQLDNPERDREKGLGLGLAIVERLAELLAHPVDVRSVPGRGSVFRVQVAGGRKEDAIATEAAPVPGSFESLRGRLVVVIDDDRMVLEAMSQMLSGWGLDVACAESGAMILGKLATAPRTPDIVLCDYRLRNGESGIEVIRAIRDEFNADIPSALITGDTGPERLKEARASGLPLLHKPVNAARMRALVASLLREAGAESVT
jgi:two-component system, sensor histidine kinase